jgi:hypothetical protein
LESGFSNSTAPLAFIRPVGFSAADSLRLMQAAQRLSEHVRWRMAPPGVQADVYLAHRASVVFGDQPTRPQRRDSGSGYSSTMNSAYEHSMLHVSEEGWYKNRPVCVLGSPMAHTDDDDYHRLPGLEFPAVLQELRLGLVRMEEALVGLRMLYALGRCAWEERNRWKTHRLQMIDGNTLIGVIEPAHWKLHVLDDVPVELIEMAHPMPVPQSSLFAAPGFTTLPLERALWEFAKRCPESMLVQILPSIYQREKLTHRRPNELSERELGDHCVAILRALDTHSRNAEELQSSLRLSRPALLRALACLALTRTIRPERFRSHWTHWLPHGLRKHLFAPSTIF